MANIGKTWTNVASVTKSLSSGFSVTYYLDVRYTSQDINSNTTARETRLRSVVTSGSASGYGYEFTLTGASKLSGSGLWTFQTETILTGSGNVTHNADGTGSETVTATAKNDYWTELNATLSGTATYPTIARVSQVTTASNSVQIGSSVFIATNTASSSFRHTIEILVGNNVIETFTGIINGKTWTPAPATYNALFPNSPTGTATIRCTTYNGETALGTSTATITLQVDTATYRPSLSASSTATLIKVLRGVTDVTVRAVTTMPADSGSTIASVRIQWGGASADMTVVADQYSYTIRKVTVSSATVTVTDSRGVSVSDTVSWDLIPYVALTVTGKTTRTGAVSDSVILKYSGNYYTGSDYENTLTVTAEYEGNTVTLTPTINNEKHTYSGTKTLTGLDYNMSHTIVLTATDKQGSVTYYVTVPVSAPVWSAGRKNKINHFDVHGDLRVVAQNDPSKGVNIKHNGTNFWLGATQKASEHFLGGMYLSTGYDGTKGNETIKVAVPNDTNTNSDIYSMWHEGNAPIRAYFSEVDWSTGSHSADDAPDGLVWCRALNVTNLPVSTGFGWLMTIGNNLQLFALHSTTGVTGIYYRGYHSSTWDAWNLLASMDVEAVDYNALTNKPKINSVTLTGNQTSSDLKLQDPIEDLTDSEIDNIIFGS